MLGFSGQFKGILDNFHIFCTIVLELAYFFKPVKRALTCFKYEIILIVIKSERKKK
jgi:hypothetical protein